MRLTGPLTISTLFDFQTLQVLAQQNAANSEESAASALELDNLAHKMQKMDVGAEEYALVKHRLERLKRCRATYELACRSGAALFHYHSPEFIPWAVRLRGRRAVPLVFDCMEDFEGYARQRRGIPDWLRGGLAFGVRRFLATAAMTSK